MAPKYALDTNIFIDAFADAGEEERLVAFHVRYAPFEYLSAVVALELRAGVRRRDAESLQANVFAPFERRGRVFAASYATWKQAGVALALLASSEGLRLSQVSRAFFNDVLLAASCREHGVTLVTRNVRDFTRIARVLPFSFVQAWP